MKYCKECVYPFSAVNLDIPEDGICSSCKTFKKFKLLDNSFWEKRKNKFKNIIDDHLKNNEGNYDCLIGVSGGKDSYYQAHIMANEYNLKPLLVTYHGNNYLPEGDYNRDRMRHSFNADHIVWGPSVEVLKKLNKIAFIKMGDMNWQNHCGIFTVPSILAVKFKIPLVIWGEVAWDISGMFDPDDFVEFSARTRHEHGLRGYEWDSFIDEESGLTEKDFIWAKYPSDSDILSVGVKGLYVGNFFKWDPNMHVKLMKELYGWKSSEKEFQRTYRNFSNLDDRYENGIHDLMKFIKFGYGRCSDHASKDIRTGYMNRNEGIKMVKKYDHVVSDDLYYWLDYVKMSEDEFWSVADKFRDPRVWSIDNKKWYKKTIWNTYESFGYVNLSDDQINLFNSKKQKINL